MASKIDVSALTLNALEANDVSKAVFERTIIGGDLAERHEIETGVSQKQQIVFVGNLAEVGVAITGCGFTDAGQSLPLTEKFWEPTLVGARLVHCAQDLNPLTKLFKRAQKVTPDYFDKTDSEELGIVVVAVEKAVKKMANRLVWFGDKTANTIAGGGVFANGTTLGLYTPINGLFKQIFAEVTQRVTITENAGINYAAQALPANAALSYLRAMYNKQHATMHQAKGDGATLEFQVTRAFAQNYIDSLEDKSLVFMLERTETGSTAYQYRGIPIVIRDDWDNYIALQDNGVKINLPHRALLTFKENIPVAVLSEDDLTTLESWYEKKDKTNIMDFALYIDAKLLEPKLAVGAW